MEADREGLDLVQSSKTHTRGSFVEDLTLTGAGNTSANGNSLANILIGNAGTSTLRGYEGNDVLDGGLGDTMIGGVGDDTYYSDVTGEVITETAGEGVDSVHFSVTQALQQNVELLFLTGTALADGTGTR